MASSHLVKIPAGRPVEILSRTGVVVAVIVREKSGRHEAIRVILPVGGKIRRQPKPLTTQPPAV